MNRNLTTPGRLSIWQAAFVIARRDFVAILFSRSFVFFLLGPLFPILVGVAAGGIGAQVAESAADPVIGVAMSQSDNAAMLAAREQLATEIGGILPPLIALDVPEDGTKLDPREELMASSGNLAAIVTGSPARPVLTATGDRVDRWEGRVSLIAGAALAQRSPDFPAVTKQTVATSGANEKRSRVQTAQVGQMLLFLLTMLLAGMVLSNLVEEKGNKIIEILAAAIPMDAVFLGKLFAMLGVSFVGISVWAGAAGAIVLLNPLAGALPEPAVGWPLFVGLGIVYFAMGYLLIGSVFLAIGSMAATVREVQTLSMPVTMLQLMNFFFASFAMAHPGTIAEYAAIVFPLSSSFAMLARAALQPEIWPHVLALMWQTLWVAIFIKMGASLFRRRVMKSGPQGVKKRRRFGFHRRWRSRAGYGKAVPVEVASSN
ncbi:ABC transporter permease [Altererythrobacter aquiaggeris]|uniref:ABC transporter permease n=1 Tax=Aestuarierythrobacter aquiaggeris TaxID=1898396 RepID=UPI0030183F64